MGLTFRLRSLAFIVIALVGGGCGIYWWQLSLSLDQLRAATLVQTGQRAAQLADALAEETDAIIRGMDSVVLQLRDHYTTDNASAFATAVHTTLDTLPAGSVLQISIIDDTGYIAYTNLAARDRIFVGDREHFTAHLGTNADRLFVGKPVIGRISNRWAIPLTRPIFRQSRFVGVVDLSLGPEYISACLAKLNLDRDDIVTLIRSDGPFLARSRDLADTLGKTSPVNRAFMQPNAPAQGVYEAPGAIDKVDRIFARHRLDHYPMTIFVGLGKSAALAPVEEERARAIRRNGISVALILCLALITSLLLLRIARQQEALAESESRYKTLVETGPECVKTLARDGTLLHMNRAWLDMIDADSLDQVAGRQVADLVVPEYRDQFWELIKCVFEGNPGRLEFEICSLKGVHRWLETSAVPLRNTRGEITSLLGVTRDITERKYMEMKLHEMATADFLTGLPNRRHFMALLELELARLQRLETQRAVILMLDLDHFKTVNDRFGHATGDLMLKHFAAQLREELRKIDVAGRIGGEEFAIILSGADLAAATVFAERLRLKVAQTPLVHKGQAIAQTVSIGIAALGATSADAALNRADEALYRAKGGGRNRVEVAGDAPSC